MTKAINDPDIKPMATPENRLAIVHRKVKSFDIDSKNNLAPKDTEQMAIGNKYFSIL